MAAVMHILGWKAQGLRCPDHDIECCDSQGHPLPITLIQMPNGTGKTTTLSLLRTALSGAADKNAWTRSKIDEYQKRDDPLPNGLFELRLLLNVRRVTIIMEFDFDNGRIYYKTTRGDGQVEGFDPPMEFRRFKNEYFVKFYVFDGELADNILSREHTDAQKAVESLFQIHLLGRMQGKVSDYWDEQTQGRTARDQTGLTGRTNRLNDWRARLRELSQQKGAFQKELDTVLKNLERQQERYDSEIKKVDDRAEKVRAAETAVTEVETRVHESAQGVLDSLRDPHRLSPVFAASIYELKTGLDRVKLPESAAREFFEELADEDDCVCGRPIDGEIRIAIRERAQRYLGSDDVSLLNNMKSAIDDAVGPSRTQPAEALSEGIQALAVLVDEELKARNELDELKRDAERSDPEVMRAKEEIDRLKIERNRLKDELERFNGKDDKVRLDRIAKIDPNRIFSIETIRQGIDILEEQVTEITGTLTLRRKRDLLKKIINKAHRKARDHITSEIRDDANTRIAELMPDNMIRVKEIDRCVVLEGQSSGSAGENLSIGYAFLATLFNRSGEHQLPFVVDSPANPIDYDIRPKIGQLAPILTDQFIAFVISSERERFLPALRKAAQQEIKYITLFRKSITRHAEKAEQSSGYANTADGVTVVDEQFFSDFQLDSEEDA
ncbi:MAG: AAA family ATPase [Candidatus Thiodiazotropha endolucinida]